MGTKRHKPEDDVAKMRQVDVLVSQGQSVGDAIRTIGVTEVTYYRWRKDYGGLKSDQVRRMKDLETEMPPGIVLACTMRREDARDALILGPLCHAPDAADPYGCLPRGAVIGSSSVRRQAQLLHARPDLKVVTIRGNVQTRLGKLAAGDCAAGFVSG